MRIFYILIVLSCMLVNTKLLAQCSVTISTNTNTTQLNCTNKSITLTANATGTGTITYLWNTGETTRSINVSKAGNDTVTIKAAGGGGCTTQSFITITQDISAPTVSILAFPDTVCSGSNATLVAFGASTYIWQPGSVSGSVNIITPVATAIDTVIGTALNGCKDTSTILVVVESLPKITSQSTAPQTFCLNATATPFSVTATGADITYQWFSNTVASNIGGTFLIGATNRTYTPLTNIAGTLYYYCEVSGRCSPSVKSNISGAVTVNEPPTIISQNTDAQTLCLDEPAASFSINAKGAGLTYQWFSNTVASTTGGDKITGETNAYFTPPATVAGTLYYYCEVSGSCTPSVKSNISGAVLTHPLPVATITALATTICQYADQQQVTFKGLRGVIPYTFYYNINDGPVQTIKTTGNLDAASVTVATGVLGNINYNLDSITDGNGCTNAKTQTRTITIAAGPVLEPGTTFASVCDNSGFSYPLVCKFPGTDFTWVGRDTSGISNMPASGSGQDIIDKLNNDTTLPVNVVYVVTLTNKDYPTCTGIEPFTVTVFPTPHLEKIPKDSVCDGTTYAFAATSLTPGTTFTWYRDAVKGINNNQPASGSTSLISEILDNESTENITVKYKVIMTAYGCSEPGIDSFYVVVKPTPVLTQTNLTDTICNGGTVNFTGSSLTAGTKYKWARGFVDGILPGSSEGTGTDLFQINETLTNSIPGPPIDVNYAITLTGPNGCSNIQNYIVTVYPDLKLNSNKDTTICNNIPFVYNASSYTPNLKGFSWQRIAVDGVSNATNSGTSNLINETLINTTGVEKTVEYVFTMTSVTGCTSTDILTVHVQPTPVLNNKKLSDTICNNSDYTFNATSAFNLTDYAWKREAVTGISNLTTNGTGPDIVEKLENITDFAVPVLYAITFKDQASGCKNTQYDTVTVLPSFKLNSTRTLSVCDSALFTYQATSATPGINFNWNRQKSDGIGNSDSSGPGGIINEYLNNITSNAQQVKYFFNLASGDHLTCISNDSIVVTVNPTPVLSYQPDKVSVCSGTDISYTAQSSSTIQQWVWTRPFVNGISNSEGRGLSNIIHEALVNETDFPITVTYNFNLTVDIVNQCSSIQYWKVIVNPIPKVDSIPDQYICSGDLSSTIKFHSTSPNAKFYWSGGDTKLGLSKADSTDIIPAFFAINEGKEPIENTISVYAKGSTDSCAGSLRTFKIIVNPKPRLESVLPDSVCSGDTTNKIIITSNFTTGVTYAWTSSTSSTFVSGYKNQADSGNNIIIDTLVNQSKTSIEPVSYDIRLTFTNHIGCSSNTVKTIYVRPQPEPPYFTSLNGLPNSSNTVLTVCNGSENINFNIFAPVNGLTYKWTTPLVNPNVVIRDSFNTNTVISFFNPGTAPGNYRIYAIATDTVNGGCTASAYQKIKVDTGDGINEIKIIKKQPGNLLIYPDNSLDAGDGYQWGYDSIISNSPELIFGPPVSIPGQVYQVFIPEAKFIVTVDNTPTLDTTNYLYWVLLKKGDCYTKVYYNGPYARRLGQVIPTDNTVQLKVYPNPNKGSFEIALKGNIYGNIEANIYNALGQVVFRKKFVKVTPEINEKFNAYNLPTGLYYLVLYSSDLKKVVSRFVIQH